MPGPAPTAPRGVLIAAVTPGVVVLAAVGALRPTGEASDAAVVATWAALAFAGLYLCAAAVAAQSASRATTARLALAGWTTLVAAAISVWIYRASPAADAPPTAATANSTDVAAAAAVVDWRAEADGHADRDWARAYYREFRAANRAHWQPYVYWRRAAYDGRFIHVDSDGKRRTVQAGSLPEDAPKVFVFGGSTIWGTGAADDQTIPSWLARGLHESGHPARVVNLGETGYVSTQGILRLLLELRAGNVPDVAVFYDGANELAAAAQTGEPGIPMNEVRRREDFLRGAGAAAPAPPERSTAQLALETIAAYRANLRVLQALGREYGFEVCCFWQPVPYLHKPLTAYEQRASGRRDLGEIMRLGYDAISAADLPPFFADLSRVFETTTAPRYVDWCHLIGDGNAEVAAAMLPRVVAALEAR